MDDYTLLSKNPKILYFWLIASSFLSLFFFSRFLWSIESLFFILFNFWFLYYSFCRKSGKILINSSYFKVDYLFFWETNMEIPFSEIIEIDYKKGFFDNNAPMKNRYQFKNICYDTLYLKLKTKEITIHINTEFGGFNKLLDVLRKKKNIIIHDYQ